MTVQEKYKKLVEHIFEQKLYLMLWRPLTDEAKLKKSAEQSLLDDLVRFIETMNDQDAEKGGQEAEIGELEPGEGKQTSGEEKAENRP